MKALPLIKHNIDTLLKARGQTRRDLASWVRQSANKRLIDPWISHIFTNPDAEIQTKYLDRIADFFGIAVYQLFQPGISPLTERRKGGDRRSGRDRRVSHVTSQLHAALSPASANLTEADIADLIRLRTLSGQSRAVLRENAEALARAEREAAARSSGRRVVDTTASAPVAAAVHGNRRPRADRGRKAQTG